MLKNIKPTTPGQRGTVLVSKSHLWKGEPMVGNRVSVPTRKRQCSSHAFADEVVRGTYVGTAQGQPPDPELC